MLEENILIVVCVYLRFIWRWQKECHTADVTRNIPTTKPYGLRESYIKANLGAEVRMAASVDQDRAQPLL